MKEANEITEFCNNVLDDLQEHKSDDGKIDGFEISRTVAGNLYGGIKAGMGCDKIMGEYKAATDEEKEKLYKDMADIAVKLTALLGLPQ